MRLAREEVFGPVHVGLPLERRGRRCSSQVNGVDFGLTGSIWTQRHQHRAPRAKRIQTGYVWINNSSQHFMGAPFGGVKQSGIGPRGMFCRAAGVHLYEEREPEVWLNG
jgi:betaine-aldehyde dehydrogenase